MRGQEHTLMCSRCRSTKKIFAWDGDTYQANCPCGGTFLAETMSVDRVGSVIPDDIPGGMIMQHVEPGRKVYSRTELKQVLANHRSKHWPQGCKLADAGWVGPTDQHFKRSGGTWADLRTRELRQEEMAKHLGLTVEEYRVRFP